MSNFGCLICGEDLKYYTNSNEMICSVCGNKYDSNANCVNGHFICDQCHQMNAYDFIEQFCLNTKLESPFEIISQILRHKSINMHGPEHHFLVPAVLLTTIYSLNGQSEKLKGALKKARKRAANVLGGFCGFYGACGAGIGNGIFMSIILNATPVSEKEYSLANKITSETLNNIANAGGPRCCKRNTFIAIETAVNFMKKYLNTTILMRDFVCNFNLDNKECKYENCKFYDI